MRLSPHLVQSIYGAKRGERLDRPCSMLIRLARLALADRPRDPRAGSDRGSGPGFTPPFRKLTGLASILRDRAGALLQATRAWLKVPQTAILVRLPLRRRSGRARSNPAPRSRARFRLSFGLAPRSPTASAPPRFPLPPALGARP